MSPIHSIQDILLPMVSTKISAAPLDPNQMLSLLQASHCLLQEHFIHSTSNFTTPDEKETEFSFTDLSKEVTKRELSKHLSQNNVSDRYVFKNLN